MTSNPNPYIQCPCESGKKAKFCCLVGKNWDKKPTTIIKKSHPDFSHSKCYASSTNRCVHKISGEHHISEVVLNNLASGKGFNIAGMHWQKPGEFKPVAKSGFVGNVLCSYHNEALSPFDLEMGKFHRCIYEYDQAFNDENATADFKLFCGEDLEKWFLKTTCAFISSNQIYQGKELIKCEIPQIFVDILYNEKAFPDSWGLYVDATPRTITHHNFINVNFSVDGKRLLKMSCTINGLDFHLLLSNTYKIPTSMIYRPRGIEFKNGDVKKIIEISWQNKSYDQGVFLDMQRRVKKDNVDWDKWLLNKYNKPI